MMYNYSKFLKNINEGKVVDNMSEIDINKYIDDAYKHFQKLQKPVNSLDIIEQVEILIGKELDDDDYEELYFKITGEHLDADEILDLDEEEKYIIK